MELTKKYSHKLIENGIFYYPAYEHYGVPSVNVCCIGYKDKDLCLKCVEIKSNSESNKSNYSQKLGDLSNIGEINNNSRISKINMVQDIENYDELSTYMMHNSIRPLIRQNSMILPRPLMRQNSIILPKDITNNNKYAPFMIQDFVKSTQNLNKDN